MLCTKAPAARGRRRVGQALLACIACAVMAAVLPASAGAHPTSCRASAVRVLNVIEPVVSNDENQPCKTDADELLNQTVGPITFALLETKTGAFPPDNIAHATAARVIAAVGPGLVLRVWRARSTAATCHAGPAYGGSSEVTDLSIGGGPPVTYTTPTTIDLGLVKIHLNEVISTPNEVIRRAMRIEFVLRGVPDIVIAEARAGCPPVVAATPEH